MPGPVRSRSTVRLTLAAVLAVLLLAGRMAAPATDVDALSRWTGGIDLYRSGVFTTQQTWLWCTAADVQIIRNIVDHATDHSRSTQQRYFDYMRAHDRYAIPLTDGVDPAGWAAGLRRFVDSRYQLYPSGSFDSALRSAVTNLRRTNLPVGITVSHGNHAWVLTGFTATADPAATTRFSVTSVRVVGPLWGLQSRSYGYDMRPDTKLTPGQLKGFFTPWHYAGIRMAWEGQWVSVQPVAKAARAAAATPKPTARPTAKPTPRPTPRVTLSPMATADLEPGRSRDGDREPLGSRRTGRCDGTGIERGPGRRGGGDRPFRSGRRWSPDGRTGRCRGGPGHVLGRGGGRCPAGSPTPVAAAGPVGCGAHPLDRSKGRTPWTGPSKSSSCRSATSTAAVALLPRPGRLRARPRHDQRVHARRAADAARFGLLDRHRRPAVAERDGAGLDARPAARRRRRCGRRGRS